MAVAFCTWLWGDKYDISHVAKLAAGVQRNYRKPYRFVVFSDRLFKPPVVNVEVKPIASPELIGRGCYCRLRMFDPSWQAWHGFGDRIVSLDLDLVITGELEPLFEDPATFLILRDANAVNPNPFNCSLMMLRAGHHAEVWSDFTLEKAARVQFYQFPDDQAWIWHKLPDAHGWKAGEASGVYGFQKRGWPGWPRKGTNELPVDARIVAFFGWRKPEMFTKHPWVRVHWR